MRKNKTQITIEEAAKQAGIGVRALRYHLGKSWCGIKRDKRAGTIVPDDEYYELVKAIKRRRNAGNSGRKKNIK